MAYRETLTGCRVGPVKNKPHKIQQDQVQGSAPFFSAGKSQAQVQPG